MTPDCTSGGSLSLAHLCNAHFGFLAVGSSGKCCTEWLSLMFNFPEMGLMVSLSIGVHLELALELATDKRSESTILFLDLVIVVSGSCLLFAGLVICFGQ